MQKLTTVLSTLCFFVLLTACSPVQQTADNNSASKQTSPTDDPGGGGGETDTGLCSTNAQQSRFDSFAAGQLNWYTSHLEPVPVQKFRSIYYKGTNGHAVVVVHGFNSSPHNQRDVIIDLASRGFTVIAPLLAGFGSTAKAANMATLADWQRSMDDAVSVVSGCHSKVSLLGHSFGGSLVTEAVTSGRLPKVAKVVSLAPFYKSSTQYLNLFVDQVALQHPELSMSALTGLQDLVDLDAYEFFQIDDADAGFNEPVIPMLALQKMIRAQSLFTNLSGAKSSVPMFLGVSGADFVVDSFYASTYVRARFANTSGFSYAMDEGVGHSFQRSDTNPRFADMMSQISTFLRN